MQQIAEWLEKLGLGQYAQRFAENDINFAILSDLTDQDLKEIGVSSLGHRRLLLRAIAELNIAEKGTTRPGAATPASLTPPQTDAAERRQVTVMFCDLVGSTALSARMDGFPRMAPELACVGIRTFPASLQDRCEARIPTSTSGSPNGHRPSAFVDARDR